MSSTSSAAAAPTMSGSAAAAPSTSSSAVKIAIPAAIGGLILLALIGLLCVDTAAALTRSLRRNKKELAQLRRWGRPTQPVLPTTSTANATAAARTATTPNTRAYGGRRHDSGASIKSIPVYEEIPAPTELVLQRAESPARDISLEPISRTESNESSLHPPEYTTRPRSSSAPDQPELPVVRSHRTSQSQDITPRASRFPKFYRRPANTSSTSLLVANRARSGSASTVDISAPLPGSLASSATSYV